MTSDPRHGNPSPGYEYVPGAADAHPTGATAVGSEPAGASTVRGTGRLADGTVIVPGGSTPQRAAADTNPTGSNLAGTDDRSLGEIVSDLTGNFSTLVSQEIALAKAEATQEVKRAGTGAGMFGGAAVAGLMALLFLSLAIWWALGVLIGSSDHPALGWSGLIVAVVYAIVAGVLAASGRSKVQAAKLNLPQTTDTVSKIPNALKGDEEENR